MAKAVTSADAIKLHQILTSSVERLSERIEVIAFRKHDGQQVLLACLYATILQSTRECLHLMAGPTLTLPTVLRTMLEAYADLRATLKDAGHADRMLATFNGEKRRHLKAMLASSDNLYHQSMKQRLDPALELKKVDAELSRLELMGHRPMSNRRRFEFAGLENEYESLYWLLCLESHNAVTALGIRHVIDLDCGDFDLTTVKENSVFDICKWCDALFRLLSDATVRLYEFLGIKRLGDCERDLQAFDALTSDLFG